MGRKGPQIVVTRTCLQRQPWLLLDVSLRCLVTCGPIDALICEGSLTGRSWESKTPVTLWRPTPDWPKAASAVNLWETGDGLATRQFTGANSDSPRD
jgi:hypothetical protein